MLDSLFRPGSTAVGQVYHGSFLFADTDGQTGGNRKRCQGHRQRSEAGQPQQVANSRQSLQGRLQRPAAENQHRDVQRQNQQRQQQAAALETNGKRGAHRAKQTQHRSAKQQGNQQYRQAAPGQTEHQRQQRGQQNQRQTAEKP